MTKTLYEIQQLAESNEYKARIQANFDAANAWKNVSESAQYKDAQDFKQWLALAHEVAVNRNSVDAWNVYAHVYFVWL